MGYITKEEVECKRCGRTIHKKELQYDSSEGRICLECYVRAHIYKVKSPHYTRERIERSGDQMSKENTSTGVANFTTVVLVFIVFFGAISLLMNNVSYVIYMLLLIFGLALGLLKKGGKVNTIIKIALVILSVGAVAFLFLWFYVITIVFLMLLTVLSPWSLLGALPVLLLAPIYFFAVPLLRKSRAVNAIIRIMLLIFIIGAIVYSYWWVLANISFILWFSFNILPVPLLVAIGFFAAILSLGDRKPQVQNE